MVIRGGPWRGFARLGVVSTLVLSMVASTLVVLFGTALPASAGWLDSPTLPLGQTCGLATSGSTTAPPSGSSFSPNAPLLGGSQLFSNADGVGGPHYGLVTVSDSTIVNISGGSYQGGGLISGELLPLAGGAATTFTFGGSPGHQDQIPLNVQGLGIFQLKVTPNPGQQFLMTSPDFKTPCEPPATNCPACDAARRHAAESQGESGDPVRTWSGGFHESFTDIALGGRSEVSPLVTRTHWSIVDPYDNLNYAFGKGWKSNLDMYVMAGPALASPWAGTNATYKVIQEAGAPVDFVARSMTSGIVTFAAAQDVTATLTRNTTTGAFTFTRPGRTYTFDGSGQLLSAKDRNDLVTNYERFENTVTIHEDTPSGGRSIGVTWGASGHVETAQTYAGGVGLKAIYTYNAEGDLDSVSVSDPSKPADGTYVTHYTYEHVNGWNGDVWGPISTHQLSHIQDPKHNGIAGHDLVNGYNAGRVVSQTYPSGAYTTIGANTQGDDLVVTTTSYGGGSVVAPTNPPTLVEYYANRPIFDATGLHYQRGQLRRKVWGSGYGAPVVRDFEYDAITGAVKRISAGNVTLAAYTYDASGNVLTATSYFGQGASDKRTVNYSGYTLLGWPQTIVDNAGITTTNVFDAHGNLESTCTPVVSVGPANCAQTLIPKRLVDPVYGGSPGDVTSVIDPQGKTWKFAYDQYGHRTSSTNPPTAGSPAGQTVSHLVDAVGRPLQYTSARGFTTTIETNIYGAPTKLTDPNAQVMTINRSRNGEPLTVVQPGVQGGAARTTTYAYDDDGHLLSTAQPNGVVQTTTYFPNGRVQSQTQNGLTTTYEYFDSGLQKSVTDPDLRSTTFSYDWLGHLQTRTIAGDTTTYATDLTGAPTSIDYSGTSTPDVSGFTYDAMGRRTSSTDGAGTSSWTWDSVGHLLSNTDGAGQTIGYTWDLNDNVTKLAYPGGNCGASPVRCVTRNFDDANRFTSVVDWNNKTTSFAPDADGNYTTFTYPTTTATTDTFVYDKLDRMTSAVYKRSTTTQGSFTYQRFGSGELKSSTPATIAGAATENYGYDGASRLCWVNPTANAGACEPAPGTATADYSYDASDNLTRRADGTNQAFDPADQLCYTTPLGTNLSATPPGANCQLPGNVPANATKYTYDGRGNRITSTPPSGGATTYGYDLENRLTSVTKPTTPTDSGEFHAGPGARVLDTRAASRAGLCPTAVTQCTTLAAGQTRDIQITGQGGVPSSGVAAVAITVTAVAPAANGNLTVWAAGDVAPAATALNYVTGGTIGNTVFAKVSPTGRISIRANTGGTDVTVDVQGWFTSVTDAAAGGFRPLTQAVVTDTRTGSRQGLCPTTTTQCTPWATNETRDVQISGLGGIPASGVDAVAINIVAKDPTAQGRVIVWPAGTAEPLGAAGPRYNAGTSISVASIVKLSPSGQISVKVTGATDIVIDVQGWFAASAPGQADLFTALNPDRLLDTRPATRQGRCPDAAAQCTTLVALAPLTLQVTGRGGVPSAGVTAVALNIKVTNPASDGSLRVSKAGTSTNLATVSFKVGDTIGNTIIVPVSVDGRIAMDASLRVPDDGSNNAVDVVVDVQGWWGPGTSSTTSYSYDSGGLRRTKTSPTGSSTFAWASTGGLPLLLAETNRTSGATYWIYGPGGLPVSQINPDGSTIYLRHDQLGSTRLVSDAAGNVTSTFNYDAYGKPTAANAATPFGYAGQYTDAETGFQYLRARYYDPSTGQFLTRDPFVTTTRSAHGYASGGPTNSSDPSGLFPSPRQMFDWLSGDWCDALEVEIEDLRDELKRRIDDQIRNESGDVLGGDVDNGHLQQFQQKQARLENFLKEYKDHDCNCRDLDSDVADALGWEFPSPGGGYRPWNYLDWENNPGPVNGYVELDWDSWWNPFD